MSLTDVSDIEVIGSQLSLTVKCKAKMWNQEKSPHSWGINSAQHFACCGMRTMQRMDVFSLCPEFQTIGFCRVLRDALQYYFRGGNVSFVLNSSQRGKLAEMLKNMNRIGAGIKEIPFANKNMRNTNYLYIWTYQGRKPKKTAIAATAEN